MADKKENNNKFENINAEKRPSIVSEFWFFLKHNKKWWLLPILIILLLLGLLVLISGSSLAPFIYPLF
ncbi:MAG: hypothetical protein JXA96_09520 [Sedimentisphaerales bacterium]|nr:hypothetical protein [Sedimentisphaerales bacterium]